METLRGTAVLLHILTNTLYCQLKKKFNPCGVCIEYLTVVFVLFLFEVWLIYNIVLVSWYTAKNFSYIFSFSDSFHYRYSRYWVLFPVL